MHRNDIDLVECDLTIERLPKSTLRQLEPDSAQPYQPPRCWLPGEHTGGPKERPQPAAPRPRSSSAPNSASSQQQNSVSPRTIYKTNTYRALKAHQPINTNIQKKTQYPCLDAHSERLSTRRRKPLQTRRRTSVGGSERGDGGCEGSIG